MKYKLFLISLACIILSANCIAQKQISGKVTDFTTKEPLIGVTVVVKGTTNGTITDMDGAYTLSVPEDGIITFSSIGYLSEEITVGNQEVIDVGLITDITSLDEIVVVGYGTQKKVNLTGAVETVGLEDVDTRSITNSGQILQGKIPGVQITQNSGQPGNDDATIRIRGVSSLDNNNSPLVIIDGVEGELGDVNPNDIASISVLKDASSAAIYGSRASAGVILIETKKGNAGIKIRYSGSVSIQRPTALPNVVDAATYAELLNEARVNSGYQEKFDSTEIAAYRSGDNPSYANTDWYDEYFSSAIMHKHFLNISGGQTDKYNFSVSAGYLDQEGVLYGTSENDFSFRAGLNSYFLDNKLKIGTMLDGYQKEQEELSSSTSTVLTAAATTAPTAFFRSQDTTSGNTLYGYAGRYFAYKDAGGGITRDRNKIKYQINIEINPVNGLIGRVLYGKYIYDYNYVRLLPSVTLAGNVYDGEGTTTGVSSLEQTVMRNTQSTLFSTLSYNISLGEHDFTLLGGFEQMEFISNTTEASIEDLLANEPVFSLGDASTRYVNGDAYEYATRSFFSRFNYVYNNKYLFEANLRKDGSSRFAEGNRWGTFPSVSAGWRISEESFMNSVYFISELKLRASWGELGNQNISEYYASYDRLDPDQNYSFGGSIVAGTGTTVLANRNVTWETSEQKDIGLDGSLFKNRLSFSIDYFKKTNSDLLLRISLPGSLGLADGDPPYQNVGAMTNQGFELSLGYKKAYTDFNYDINANFSYSKSRVEDVGNLEYLSHDDDLISGYSPPSGVIRSYVGEEFASYYGYLTDGIYQISDFEWQDNSDQDIDHEDRVYQLKDGMADPSGIMSDPAPGDIKYRDLNGDNEITEEDKTIIGNSQPKWAFALNFNTSYKNVYFNVMFQGVTGVDAYLIGALVSPFWNGTAPITEEMAESRWTPENPSETNQRLYSDVQRCNIVSDYYLQDASYLRVKNIQIGYVIPKRILEHIKFDNIKAYLSVENAFTFTSFTGFDPERTYNKITSDFHPQVQVFTLGINANF